MTASDEVNRLATTTEKSRPSRLRQLAAACGHRTFHHTVSMIDL